MLSLKTCLRLKEAGWPQVERFRDDQPWIPTLEELLEAMGVGNGYTLDLKRTDYGWCCCLSKDGEHTLYANPITSGAGHTDPSEAVATLWLKLKEAKDA